MAYRAFGIQRIKRVGDELPVLILSVPIIISPILLGNTDISATESTRAFYPIKLATPFPHRMSPNKVSVLVPILMALGDLMKIRCEARTRS